MREIKFRCFSEQDNIMYQPLALNVIAQLGHNFNDNIKLMQYTGLKDKNGVEIYEGDIVRLDEYYRTKEESNIGVVTWTKYQYAVESNDFSLLLCKTQFLEVIGNICENKDLLN